MPPLSCVKKPLLEPKAYEKAPRPAVTTNMVTRSRGRLTPPTPSRIHHLGFVVDDLEAAAAHLKRDFPEFLGEFTLLERAERWSLYGHVQIGTIRFMLQLSEIKPRYRGLTTPVALAAQNELYDYASRDYGVRLG